ncbi:helix-turn-helix domain-containing protein [Marinicrinis sediminis]|uniref:Helix-turn-helix domain-containing protein n=1 Tax=Marinicrinis sediminis TaxID=1652465 RepID=A0ABW5R8Q4_9BACL
MYSKCTGISRNTITALQGGAIKRIDFETLDRLCKGLNVRPSDLIVYTEK